MKERQLVEQFWKRLAAARAGVAVDFDWYPYQSLSNTEHLWELLGEEIGAFLGRTAGDGPIADIGCGDGDLAFFLERLGFEVDAVDNPVFNHNGMRGVQALRTALASRVRIGSTHLDGVIKLPRERYSFVFLLGVLYHLRNPFLVLDTLARCSQRLILSTRVAERFPSVDGDLRGVPAAYLLDATELNADDSNYWIFTPAGLERMLERTHWKVEKRLYKRAGGVSGPTAEYGDERVFLLVRSTYGAMAVELGAGWHEPENEGWRWTERRFSISFSAAAGRNAVTLALYVPDALLEGGGLELAAYANGRALGLETFAAAGLGRYSRVVTVDRDGPVTVDFQLSRAIPPRADDGRELGVIVQSCTVESV